MRERLDCAILEIGNPGSWSRPKEGAYANGRLNLHHLPTSKLPQCSTDVLVDAALPLQRFDVCLVVVGETNLALVRQAMLAAMHRLRTPVIGVVCQLKARAIDDLYNLGMADFVRDPLCPEEVRIRTERLLNQPRLSTDPRYITAPRSMSCAVSEQDGWYLTGGAIGPDVMRLGMSALNDAASAVLTDAAGNLCNGTELGDIELEAFAVASASRCAGTNDSFGDAKSKVVERFERAYLLASLAKSSGNIAMAARGAKKHRRAYWALMQKYDIDAAPFRKGLPPDQ